VLDRMAVPSFRRDSERLRLCSEGTSPKPLETLPSASGSVQTDSPRSLKFCSPSSVDNSIVLLATKK
jgi:hypothetical protein